MNMKCSSVTSILKLFKKMYHASCLVPANAFSVSHLIKTKLKRQNSYKHNSTVIIKSLTLTNGNL